MRRRLGNAGDILVKDIQMLGRTLTVGPVPCRRHAAQLLDIRAEKRFPHEDHFEAIIIGWIMAAGYFNAAVYVVQNGFGII